MDKKDIYLSVVLAVYNEEANLKQCLFSIKDIADEIVIVDGGSTDKTVHIAENFNARIISADNPPMFHINKQKALDQTRGKWILQLDADEIVTGELKEEIIRTIKNERDIHGYFIARKNYFWGHWMRKTAQYPDFVMRLVRKEYARFPCKSVHEQIEVTGNVGYLAHPMIHNSYKTLDDYWKKADIYTSLAAKEMAHEKIPLSFNSWVEYMFVKPIKIFFSLFVRHKGFLDGVYGLVFSYYSALHPILSYKKYRTMKQ